MNSQQIKNIYTANGLCAFQLNNYDDLMKVHGVSVNEIQGYNNLSQEHKSIFGIFILNFYNAQGLETRTALLPSSINYVLAEQSLGKGNDSDDYYIPLGTTITAIYADKNETKILRKWKDKKYKNIPCTHIEKEYYLRFEYQTNRHGEWMHVLSGTRWY
jgi:hypothetical protein